MGQEVKNNSLQWWKMVLLCLRQFILAIIILLGIPVFASVGFSVLKEFNPNMLYQLVLIGPWSAYTWILTLAILAWYPIALIVWVVRDVMKLKKQGIRTMPFLLAMGMIIPAMLSVFSIYLIRQGMIRAMPFSWVINMIPLVSFSIYFILRDVFWLRKLRNNVSILEQEIKPDQQGAVKKWFVSNKRVREIFLSVVAIAFVVYAVVVVTDLPQKLNKGRTEEQVAKIHATKLTLDDVMGKNLPPDPGADADKTVQGIDANQNGIRDDVELAIFKEYPDSAKIRAALLQYAFMDQLETTQELVNSETVTAIAEEGSRAGLCITEIVPSGSDLGEAELQKSFEMLDNFKEFVESRQFNTAARKEASKNFYKGKLRSFSTPRDKSVCDIDLSSLLN